MKKHVSVSVLSVALGLAGFVLRLLQNRTGFEPETGLPIPGNLPALLVPVLLAASAVILLLAARSLRKGPEPRPFSTVFSSEDPLCLTVIVLGAFLMAASGVLEIVSAVSGQSQAVLSADGMMILAGNSGASRSAVVMGVLSLAAAVCLFPAVMACRREGVSPLPVLAVPALLLVRLILAYRLHSVDPVLGNYYVELLSLIFLILGFYRLSGFAVGSGAPRVFSAYAGISAVLALTLLADGFSGSALLALGGSAAMLGFQILLSSSAPTEDVRPD